MSISRDLAVNTGVQVVGKIFSTVLGVLIVSMMGRHLGTEGFGMYSTANAFFQFFAIILDLGLNVTLVQMLGEHAGNTAYENRVVSATFTLRFASALVLIGSAPFIGLLFPYPAELKLAIFAIWGSFFVTSLNQIVIGVHQRHLKMHIVALAEILGRIVLFIGVLLAVFLNWGLTMIVLIVSVGSTLNFLINFLVARRYASFSWNWDFKFWKEILRRSWPIGISILFSLTYFKADTLILSLVRPQTEVGLYGAAYRVLEVVVSVPFMYAGVMLPLIAKFWAAQDRPSFTRLFGRSLDAMTMLAAPLMAGTIVLATQGMVLVFGKSYAPAGGVLRLLIIATGIIFFGTISSHVIVALQVQQKMLPIYIITALITLAGYLFLIPRYGMWAAAWLTIFSELCVAIGSTIMSFKYSGAKWNPKDSLKALFSASLMGLVIYPFRDLPLFIPVVLGVLSYAGLLFLTGTLTKSMIRGMFYLKRGQSLPMENPLE